MSIKRKSEKPQASSSDAAEYDNLEVGEYEARLVYVADLGMHPNKGPTWDKPDVQKIALGFEVLENPVTIDGEEHPRVLWADSINVYYSLTDKGKELVVYNIFDPKAEAGDDPDWDKQLGQCCSISVVHVNGKDDKSEEVYDNISRISVIQKKYQKNVPEATITDMCTGGDEDMDSPVMKALRGLAKWQFDQRLDGGEGKTAEEVESKPKPAPSVLEDIDEDSIPF